MEVPRQTAPDDATIAVDPAHAPGGSVKQQDAPATRDGSGARKKGAQHVKKCRPVTTADAP